MMEKSPLTQRGAILVVSLIMLLLLTIIGLAGMRTTSLEEKMAGNSRDRALAFQSAEAALSIAEQDILSRMAADDTLTPPREAGDWGEALETAVRSCIENNSSIAANAGSCGPKDPADFDPFENDDWDYANVVSASGTSLSHGSGNLQAPKYMIQLVRKDFVSTAYIFKVTSKGFGADTGAEVVLQSTFSVIPN